MTIAGTGFGATQGSSTVTFNGVAATPTTWSASSIAAHVPSGATTGNIVVTVGGTSSNGVAFTVQTTPTITWATPSFITYGTALSATQLDATANVAGTFVYTPVAGTVPTAGLRTLSVTFTPTDTTDYTTATKTVSLDVEPAKPTITWATPAAISAGTALSATQLNATANVSGTFAYTPAVGYVPAAGTDTLSVIFTPTDNTDYSTVIDTVSLVVNGPAPIITAVAGTGKQSYSGDGGPAIDAAVDGPTGMTFDSAGNLYFADSYSNRVRKVDAVTGFITTVAGDGVYNSNGDGGLATSAAIGVTDVALDSAGNMYLTDIYSSTIREVTASTGIITTIAGNGTAGYNGDGPATSVELNTPRALTLDAWGNVYIVDDGNNRVRKFNVSTGMITTIAGTGTAADAGDGGSATAAELYSPDAIAFGPSGNLYVGEWLGSRVREINMSTGIITTVAGGNNPNGFIGDGGPATQAYVRWVTGIGFDAAGNLYICDEINDRIRKVTMSTGIITTVAGVGIDGYSGDGGSATSAEIGEPSALAFSPQGNLFIANVVYLQEVNYNAVVTWPTPAPIVYGTALSGAQLDATANVPGTFAYTPAAGTVPATGTDTLSVVFTPTDTTDYSTATGSVVLTVTQVTPTLSWPAPAAITYGTALSGTQLDATASVPGTFTYDPAAGTVLPFGDNILSVIFTPTDTTDYETVTETVPLTVSGTSGGGSGPMLYSYTLSYQLNSNVQGYTDTVMGAWGFSYDNLNRLSTSQGSQPGNSFLNYCWSYDSFGNRTQQVASSDEITGGGSTQCSPANPQPLTYNANNQVSGGPVIPVYDAAGDVTNDGTSQYLYNADGQICAVEQTYHGSVTRTGYIYDADGNRVAKGNITSMSCDPSVNGFATENLSTTNYVRDQAGNQLSEFSGTSSNMAWAHTNVYANGVLMATDDTTETHFYLNDWLGTRRFQTSSVGNDEQTCSSLPYGDGETCAPPPSGMLFTGKERDPESGTGAVGTGNDYFGARYYASTMGRFLSPDPSQLDYADPTYPQSLNLYGYVQNNPLMYIDPSGLALTLSCYSDLDTNSSSTNSSGNTVTTVTGGAQHCTTWDDGMGDYEGFIPRIPHVSFPTPPINSNCRTGFGIGFVGGADAGAGLGPGATATGSGGGAILFNGFHLPNLVGFLTGAVAAGSHGHPAQSTGPVVALGAGGAVGGGAFFTNATTASQLNGSALTFSGGVDVGLGLGASVSLAKDAAGNTIWSVTVTGGYGYKVYGYAATTKTKAGGTGPKC